MKAKRNSNIFNFANGNATYIRTLLTHYPGRTFYKTGVRMGNTMRMILPSHYHIENPNVIRLKNTEIIEKGTVKPLPVLKKPITVTYAQNVVEKKGVVEKDGKGEVVSEVNNDQPKNVDPKTEQTNSKEGLGESEEEKDNTDLTGNAVQEQYKDMSSPTCTCKCKSEPAKGPVIDTQTDSFPSEEEKNDVCDGVNDAVNDSGSGEINDDSANFRAKQIAPLKETEEILKSPVPDPRKYPPSNETLMKAVLNSPIPLSVEEYHEKSAKRRKLSKVPKFKMID